MGTSAEIIWYHNILSRLKSSYDELLCQCFINYLRYKNDFFKDKVQQSKIHGLEYFQDFYDKATELKTAPQSKKNNYYYIFEEQCRTGNLDVLELKISPKIENSSQIEILSIESMKRKTLEQIKSIVGMYKLYIENRRRLNSNDSNFNFPRLGIIYHFIKVNHSDNFSGANCTMYDLSDSIDCFDYSTQRKNSIRFLEALYSLFEDHPLLTDYVVGIDAASAEHDAEPWVYAPVFKKARIHCRTTPYSMEKGTNIQNIGFTYHVGEDFRHIISGLRHIDEVLTHFDYHSGDRLGHAIALGVDIDNLAMQSGMVAIPVIEYLENLLWMWQYTNENGILHAPENLEFKIMKVARLIYGNNMNGINAFSLWRAYQKKFKSLPDSVKKRIKKKDGCSLKNKLESNESWTTEELTCSHYCPCFYEIYNKPIFVSTNDSIEFYKELQKSLIIKVECMGVYVETNPSSNAVIGDIPGIMHHPILRLNNRGIYHEEHMESCVMTTINSDDPVVFSTFVENEFSYIYYSLLNDGCKREEALEWIDKIRQQGINSSFIKSRKSTNQMLEDFKNIANY